VVQFSPVDITPVDITIVFFTRRNSSSTSILRSIHLRSQVFHPLSKCDTASGGPDFFRPLPIRCDRFPGIHFPESPVTACRIENRVANQIDRGMVEPNPTTCRCCQFLAYFGSWSVLLAEVLQVNLLVSEITPL
jgi:hypothetical protein